MRGSIIGATVGVANGVGQLVFNNVNPLMQDFVKDGPGGRPKTVAGDGVAVKPHSPEAGVYGVVAHAAGKRSCGGKDVFAVACKRLNFLQYGDCLFGVSGNVKMTHRGN